MVASTLGIQEGDQGSRYHVEGEFDGLQTFKEIRLAMPPIGSVDRLILDFSQVPHVSPIELYALFVELAAVPRFSQIEICIEGLRLDHMADWSGSADNLIAFLQDEI